MLDDMDINAGKVLDGVPMQEVASEVLELAGLTPVFAVYPDVVAAVGSF